MEFDQHATDYVDTLDRSLAAFGESTEYYAAMKANLLTRCVERQLGSCKALQCLDVGCGTGVTCQFLAAKFEQVHGCDVSPAMVETAQKRVPGAHFTPCEENQPLPYADRSFDVVFTACTLHHVLPAHRAAFTAEMVRVTRPGGLVFAFEHNPLNPVTRAIVRGCEFDKSAILLRARETHQLFAGASLSAVSARFYLFVPPALRALQWLEGCLASLPLGGQYYVLGRRSPDAR